MRKLYELMMGCSLVDMRRPTEVAHPVLHEVRTGELNELKLSYFFWEDVQSLD